MINKIEVPIILTENYEYSHRDTILFKSEEDGVYWYLPDGQKQLVFKYPVKVGGSWPNPFEGGKIECISTNKSLTTPAGKFNCVVYRLYGEKTDKTLKPYAEIYMAPNVGWVATLQIKNNEKGEYIYDDAYYLKFYKLNE